MRRTERPSIHPQNRKQHHPQLSLLVDMNQAFHVFREIRTIFQWILPDSEFTFIETIFRDVVSLFKGEFPGYQACNTGYHNLKHTTDTALAMTRLMHGANLAGGNFDAREISLGIAAALFHDVGYIQEETDRNGTGAKLGPVHIQRGIEFMACYLGERGCSREDVEFLEKAIQCTDLSRSVDSVRFYENNDALIGKMLAASDLLAQTADRTYLEKLPLLFAEFIEAGIHDYETEIDLIMDAKQFNQKMNQRLGNELDGVDRYMAGHFKARWNIHRDLYRESIEKSMQYVTSFPAEKKCNYAIYLRRKYGV